MQNAENTPALSRTRPVAVGHWRAFLAVARHLNFRAAADELALTQSAVSRQIQSLEDEVGVPLFLRHTRAVELTSAGAQLQRAVAPALERMDASVRLVRQTAGRKSVAISTWASFASMWLIPRMEEFQRDNPGIDIRIDATDVPVDLETSDVDLALRYSLPGTLPPGAVRLCGEQLAIVASPWLIKSNPPVRTPADVARFTLIEAGDAHRSQHLEWLSWQRWFENQGHPKLQPQRWLYFNYAHQIVQAALSGQGLALARMPLIADALAAGDLVELLPNHRLDSPLAYWLLVGPRSAQRPEIKAFCAWLEIQAQATREAVGEVPDPDTQDDLD
ncbi:MULTISPECIES: LysR substrate-binding domain-containing protein [unclassified Acidovorax]|uniref:LysR substrate-binding domain-containing protein n=1 Tax=unclassified Acidovorax TaxID=2684926 RepID=UPI000710C7F9|nr:MULTISPECIES: LysR substrate-binding domain-containing protein [unclassified Acidovorax]KRC19584.1 LysR family transcriptional regulator [Acidovorax sp. Root219]KRC23218.1 LysR family transcriptional regulator [Acidovorax sp. Root217]